MKKYKNGFIITLSLLLFSGCNHDFLENPPYSNITAENFYNSEADAESALIGCYSALTSAYAQGTRGGFFQRQLTYMISGSTDEAIVSDGFSNILFSAWSSLSWNNGSDFIKEVWFSGYVGISRCNYLLENIDAIPMDEVRKQHIKAEARFLRGIYHMYLSMMVGAIPVNDSSTPDPNAERQPLNVVYDLIIADFQHAYENLPSRGTTLGRANKWAAAGFLAKAYVYLGSAKLSQMGEDLNFPLNSFNWVDADDVYEKARVLTADIIANSGYVLTDTYKYLFLENMWDSQAEEVLFALENSNDPVYDNQMWLHTAFTPSGRPNNNGGGQGTMVPPGEMYMKYVNGDIRRDHNLTRNIPNNSQNVEVIGGYRYYVPNPIGNIKNQPSFIAKFRYRDPATKALPATRTDGNYPLLRYADILLMHAEAIYFTTGNEADARAFFSEVRERATSDGDSSPLDVAYLKADFVEELLDERARELCYESHRRIDLTRFNRYKSAIMGLSEDRSVGYNNTSVPLLKSNWADYRVWFPIPGVEIDLNKSLVQNPGY